MIPIVPDDPSNLENIFNELKKNFRTHKTLDVKFRKETIKKMIEGFQKMTPQFDQALKLDLGINGFMSNFLSHSFCLSDMKHILANLDDWLKPQSISTPLLLGMASCSVKPDPLGVVLVLNAWNYPYTTGVPPFVSAIAAGNCVIIKLTQMAPYTSKVMKKYFDEYLDSKYYQAVEGKVQVAKAITKLPFDLICFTGSTTTGRFIAIQAAKNLTPCILQLGGKCPVIVDQTAKLDVAVDRILFGKFTNSGQTCIASDHVYVHQSIKQNFKKILLEKIQQMYGGGQNLKDQGNYGKIINAFHVQRLQRYLQEKHGGNIIYGGQIDKSKDYISPTIVEQPSQKSQLMIQQIFGPILPILTYKNLDQLIESINLRPKPLAVYLFSQNSSHVQQVQNNTFSGAFVLNDVVIQFGNNHLPFGGVGHSGYGRCHGKAGFLSFCNQKSLCLAKALSSYPNRQRFMPYTEGRKKTLSKLLKYGTITYSQIGKCLILTVFLMILIGVTITMGLVF